MANTNQEIRRHDRRQVLKIVGVGMATATGLLALSACESKPAAKPKPMLGGGEQPAPSSACQDKIPVDDATKGMRTALQYKEKSDDPAKKCSGCVQYLAAKYDNCGGCKLFAGGVNPEGFCVSYAPSSTKPG